MPDEILPQVLVLIQQLNRKGKVAQIVRRAEQLAAQRKHWTREQHIDHLLEVMEEIQREAVEKGVAIDDEREAADAEHRVFAPTQERGNEITWERDE